MKGKYLTLIGTALTLALTSNVAHAQASKFRVQQLNESAGQPVQASTGEAISQATAQPAPEHKLRSDVLKILCQDFPLNSRCQGSAASSSTSDTKPSDTKKNPDSTPGNATPGQAPSETGTPGSRKGAPPDSAPLSPTPGSGTQKITPDSGSQLTPPSDSSTPGSTTTPSTGSPTQVPGTGSGTTPSTGQ